MKNKAYILNIKNHCNEKWSEMQPQNKGRYCMQCSREVVDFTKLDNKEIGLIIEQSKGRICGRMSVSQLDRPIEIPSKKNRSKLLKLLTAIFLSVQQEVYLQQICHQPQTILMFLKTNRIIKE